MNLPFLIYKIFFVFIYVFSFVDCLRPVISGTIFVQFLVVGLVLGFTLINIVLFANLGSAIAALSFMAAVLLETTPFCVLCNYLTEDCYKLADALFQSNWIDNEKRYKKTLMYFLQKLQQPITFMAMNVFPISVGTNISVSTITYTWFLKLLHWLIAGYQVFILCLYSGEANEHCRETGQIKWRRVKKIFMYGHN